MPTRKETIGFDPTVLIHKQLTEAIDAINEAEGEDARHAAWIAATEMIDQMADIDTFIDWRKFDEDDERTHPPHGDPVLGLRVWSNPNRVYGSPMDRSTMREADLYEPFYGCYMRKRDLVDCPDDADDADDFVFAFEHGEQRYGMSDHDYCDPPKWWAPIATPQRLELDRTDA